MVNGTGGQQEVHSSLQPSLSSGSNSKNVDDVDVRSDVSRAGSNLSEISLNDQRLFAELSNPKKVDFQRANPIPKDALLPSRKKLRGSEKVKGKVRPPPPSSSAAAPHASAPTNSRSAVTSNHPISGHPVSEISIGSKRWVSPFDAPSTSIESSNHSISHRQHLFERENDKTRSKERPKNEPFFNEGDHTSWQSPFESSSSQQPISESSSSPSSNGKMSSIFEELGHSSPLEVTLENEGSDTLNKSDSPFTFADQVNSAIHNQEPNYRTENEPSLWSQSSPKLKEDEDTREEKRALILELERMRKLGYNITERYTMDHDINTIRYEHDRHKMNEESVGTISMLKEGLKFVASLVQIGNDQLGPFLDLDGFVDKWCETVEQQQGAIEGIYRKYKKKGSQAPEMTLLMAFVGALVMTHAKNKYGPAILGGIASKAQEGKGTGDSGKSGLFKGGGRKTSGDDKNRLPLPSQIPFGRVPGMSPNYNPTYYPPPPNGYHNGYGYPSYAYQPQYYYYPNMATQYQNPQSSYPYHVPSYHDPTQRGDPYGFSYPSQMPTSFVQQQPQQQQQPSTPTEIPNSPGKRVIKRLQDM